MILVDWTRLGKSYCLAGAVEEGGSFRIVRPLLPTPAGSSWPNSGWSAYLMDGRRRWEMLDMIGPMPAPAKPPHTEDVWVRDLKPTGLSAAAETRREILSATVCHDCNELFNAPLQVNRQSAFLCASAGTRSLATIVVAAEQIEFSIVWFDGQAEPDLRARLPVPGLGSRVLAVKDHHLLCRVEAACPRYEHRVGDLTDRIRAMGPTVAVRLGLSRPYSGGGKDKPAVCWLMADGFFSLENPQA